MSRREAPPAPPVHENTIASPATWEGEALDMLAHDLRNALAPIVTALDLLHLQGPDHPIVAQAGRLIRRQADVLARLADHLGSVARHADPGAAPRAGRRQARGRYQVLVIDDNRDAADSLAALLEAQGHAVRVAYDGPAAVTALEAATPDVCLLDLDLPGMSGYEVAARLRQKPGLIETRLVALTGYDGEADRQQTRLQGFDAYLVKPVDLAGLQALFARLAQ